MMAPMLDLNHCLLGTKRVRARARVRVRLGLVLGLLLARDRLGAERLELLRLTLRLLARRLAVRGRGAHLA